MVDQLHKGMIGIGDTAPGELKMLRLRADAAGLRRFGLLDPAVPDPLRRFLDRRAVAYVAFGVLEEAFG